MAEGFLIPQGKKYGTGQLADPVFFDYGEVDSNVLTAPFHRARC